MLRWCKTTRKKKVNFVFISRLLKEEEEEEEEEDLC
jgi:hypothetical protein